MFWILAALVGVLLCALAWWSSGRAKGSPDLQRRIDMGGADAKARSHITGMNNSGPRNL